MLLGLRRTGSCGELSDAQGIKGSSGLWPREIGVQSCTQWAGRTEEVRKGE